MRSVFLVEDHDEVLKIWRKHNLKGLDLVHLDAHIDFGFYPAKPIEKLIAEAKSLKDLKRKLEFTLNHLHYEKDLDKQTNIGNYIYPAMEEGIVRNFYWVVPGGLSEFRKSRKIIKNILKGILRREGNKNSVLGKADGLVSARCLGRNLIVCTLDNLPVINKGNLLDIDTDFLTINNLLNADNTKNIAKRKPWILPFALARILKEKIKSPRVTTIAYSVNGGWTPMKYKRLGDELAYSLAPLEFKKRFEIKDKAARYFNLFSSTGKKQYYQRAVRLNPAYRSPDNNYGPLYLALRKFSLAQEEFKRILRVDRKNPAAYFGLGAIASERKGPKEAKSYFQSALKFSEQKKLFSGIKPQILFNLGRVEFALKNFKIAKALLFRYQTFQPLEPQSRYLLGRIFEKEGEFSKAAIFYQDALRLGMGRIELLFRLWKISFYLPNKDDIINDIIARLKAFKKESARVNKLNLQKKKIKGLTALRKKIFSLEKKLADFSKN